MYSAGTLNKPSLEGIRKFSITDKNKYFLNCLDCTFDNKTYNLNLKLYIIDYGVLEEYICIVKNEF